MKKGIFTVFAISVIVIATFGFMPPSTENTPPGNTGSPADGKDCSSCHRGKGKSIDNIITSNGGNEYEAGKTYTITLNLKGDKQSKKYGFQVSPQNEKGKQLGKFVITNTKETKLAGNGKYINQTAAGTIGSNGLKSWNFEWVAPAKGSGDAIIYGSFYVSGPQSIVYTSKLVLKEKK